jgi:hypothetical protein
MARSTEEIYNSMVAHKATLPELAGMYTQSRTSFYAKLLWLVAYSHNLLEQFFDLFKKEIDDKLAQKEPGTSSWYVQILKEVYQDGDDLVVKDGKITYNTIDESKRIISRASYKETGGQLKLKVAKGDINDGQALSAEERTRVENFLERFKYAGTGIELISLNADKLRVEGTIYYNGIQDAAVVKTNVVEALRQYCLNLAEDGMVRRIKVVDAIQGVTGVIDADVTINGIAGVTVTPITLSYETTAGYIIEDDTTPFSSLTMTPA